MYCVWVIPGVWQPHSVRVHYVLCVCCICVCCIEYCMCCVINLGLVWLRHSSLLSWTYLNYGWDLCPSAVWILGQSVNCVLKSFQYDIVKNLFWSMWCNFCGAVFIMSRTGSLTTSIQYKFTCIGYENQKRSCTVLPWGPYHGLKAIMTFSHYTILGSLTIFSNPNIFINFAAIVNKVLNRIRINMWTEHLEVSYMATQIITL